MVRPLQVIRAYHLFAALSQWTPLYLEVPGTEDFLRLYPFWAWVAGLRLALRLSIPLRLMWSVT